MPDFDPNEYLKKQSQSNGFDPSKYLEENPVEKKNPVQSVSPIGSEPLPIGSKPFLPQVSTKAPSVLLSDAQKQQREQERIGKRFETTLLNIPTEFGRVAPAMKAAQQIQETLPEKPKFRKIGEIPRMQPTAMTEGERLGESLTEVTDFQELKTDKFTEKKTGLQKQIENAENAFRAYQGDELANQVQSYIPPEETLKIKQELGFDEKMSNVGSNFVNRLERFAPNTALAVGQTLTTLLGEDYGGEAYRMITGGVGNAEFHRMEAFDKLAKLDAEYKYSKGLIQSVQDLDLGGVAAGITDAVGSLVSTIITSAPTAGLGLYSDMVGSGLYDYNSAKANRLGITVDELYDSSQNEFFVPAILGGVGAQLEKIGLKGIKTAIMSNMAKGAGQKFALIGHNMNKEGVTELLQTGLEEVSNTLAQGKSVAEATLEFGKTLFSKKGAESYLMGVVASGSAIGGGRILKGLFSDKSKKKASQAIQAIEQQQQELSNPDLTEESRVFVYENIKNNVAELVDAVDSDVNETDGLSEDQKREVNNLNTKIQAFEVVINDPAASEETKNRAAKVLKETQAKIDDIINKKPPIVPPATGGAMVEAEPIPKPAFDTEEQLIEEGKTAEEEYKKTGDQVTYEQKIKELEEREKNLVPAPEDAEIGKPEEVALKDVDSTAKALKDINSKDNKALDKVFESISPLGLKLEYNKNLILSKENEFDFGYDLQKYFGIRDNGYRKIGDAVIRIKDHTPNYNNFVEDVENGAKKIINVVYGDYNNTDRRKLKTDIDNFEQKYPNIEIIDVKIETGDNLEDAIDIIKKDVLSEIAKEYQKGSDKKLVKSVENLLKTQTDAIQVETAGQVPVLTEATVGEEVEQGKPEPKAEVVAEEGVQEEVGSDVVDVKGTAKVLEEKYGIILDLTENKNGDLSIGRIIVPKENRSKGIGKKAMQDIVDYADKNGRRILLTPSIDFGATSVARLKEFYKEFGFIENKGKNKDFTTKDSMYRNPQLAQEQTPTPKVNTEGSGGVDVDVKGNKILSSNEWNSLSEDEQNKIKGTITDKVTDKNGNTFSVDYNLAKPIQKIINAGYSTGQSDSGTISDHPNYRYIEDSSIGKYKKGDVIESGFGAYLTFWKPEATAIEETGRKINTQEQIDKIRQAATDAGFVVEDGQVFFQPSITIRLPFNDTGISKAEILVEANKLTNKKYPDLKEKNFLSWLDKRNDEFVPIVEKEAGGAKKLTDKDVITKWNDLAKNLSKQTPTQQLKAEKPIVSEEAVSENIEQTPAQEVGKAEEVVSGVGKDVKETHLNSDEIQATDFSKLEKEKQEGDIFRGVEGGNILDAEIPFLTESPRAARDYAREEMGAGKYGSNKERFNPNSKFQRFKIKEGAKVLDTTKGINEVNELLKIMGLQEVSEYDYKYTGGYKVYPRIDNITKSQSELLKKSGYDAIKLDESSRDSGFDKIDSKTYAVINKDILTENPLKEAEQTPAQEVKQLRAEEQAELNDAIPNADQYLTDGKVDRAKIKNAKDLKKFDKIYDKYDKLITPLLPKKEAKVEKAVTYSGVNELFKSNLELSNIGTPEQYSKYLGTIFPDSKVKDIVYHGSKTKKPTQIFVETFIGKNNKVLGAGKGFYFTSDINYSKVYGETTLSIINIKNPIDFNSDNYDSLKDLEKSAKELSNKGDGVIDSRENNYYPEGEEKLKLSSSPDYIVFKPSQIHILGSSQDIEGFRNFVNKKEAKVEEIERTEFDNDEDYELYTISKETDPNVIADKYYRLPNAEDLDYENSLINDYLGTKGKINEKSWREYNDINNLTPEIRKRYIDATNKSNPLDDAYVMVGDEQVMLDPEKIIQFVLDYGTSSKAKEKKGGLSNGFLAKKRTNIEQALLERYNELTGKINITEAAAKKGFDAVNAKNKADKERKPTQKESLEEIGVTEEDINQYEKFAEQGFGEAETPLQQREFIRNEKIRALKKKAENAEDDLLSFVRKSRGQLSMGANAAEFAVKLAKIFKTYAELGIVTLEGAIDRLIEKAGQDFVNENIDAITDAFKKFDLQKENIKEKTKELVAEHKELVKKAKKAIDNNIKNVDDFAEYLDENKTSEIEDAWREANDRGKKTSSDFKDAAEKLQAKEEKERLAGKSKRMTPQRLLASSEYSDEFKQAIGEDIIYYSVLPKRVTEQEAQAIIDLKGNENAEIAIMDMNNGIPMAVRNKIAQKLIDNYEEEGNIEKAVDIFAKITEKITDAAQGLQSLSTWPKLSPAAAIYMVRKNVKKQYDAKAADAKPKTDKIDKDFKKINKESIQEALENIKKIVEKNTFPSGGAIITELPAGYGQNNKVFTRDKYLAAKKSLRGYTLSFAGGVPMEKFIVIAGYHIEATGKDFNKFTRRMKEDFGSKIKPYLKDIYAKTREQLIDSGYDKNLFLSDEDVNTQILEQEGSVFLEKLKKAIEKKDEKAQKIAIAKLQEISKEDGLWGQYKQSAANRLRNVVLTNIQKDISGTPSLEQFTDGLVKNMRAKMAELLPEATNNKNIKRPDIEIIGDAFKNFEKYKEVWEQTQNEFQEKYQDFPEILESIDAYFGEILDKPFNDKMLSRAISKGLREMGTTISDIVTKHYTVVDNTKQSLADKLVNDAGLSGTEAEALSKAVQKEFDNIATKKKSQILEKMFSKKERKKTEFRTLEQDLIRLTNLGAFRNDNIVQMYGDKMGWPKLTEENVKELERLATIVQKTEDPIKKRKAVEDLLAYQANIKGTSIMEFVTAVWYANILSGYNTQAVNFGANALNTAILFGNLVAQNPKNVKFISKGLIEGIKRGFLEGREVLITGYSPIKGKAEIPTLLERKDFSKSVSNLPKPILKLVNYASYLKYVRRLMVAADVIFFEGQKEMRAYQQAMKQASLENKENPSLNQFDRAIELVGKSDIQLQNIQEKVELEFDRELDEINNSNLSNKEKEAAIKQAEIDKKRRTFDLIEQNRDSDMIRESVDFAAQGTYNYPPQGALGAVAGGINYMVRYLPVVRYAVPFTNIIANVANETLNYTPAAFFMLKKGGIVPYKLSPLTEQQRTDLLYKGIIGTALMSTVFLLTQLKGDDDEPILEITANGTGDYAKNYALQETGWQPYSVRFKLPNGEYTGWMSYQYSPLVAALGYVGNINDLMKYTDVDEETIISLMTTSAGMTTASFFQGTFLTGLDDFASAVLDPRSVGKGQQVMEKILNAGVSAARAVLIPNLFSQVSQSVQKITNDYKKETRETIMGKFLQDVPYARDIYFNKINILGDPISPDTDKFYSANKPNKVIDLLIEKKKVFGAINRKAEQIYDITLGKQRALTDEEFFEYSKEKGQFIKNALLKDYDKFSKMTSSEFGKELAVIKKKATESARYEISDMGSDLTEIVRYIGGEPKTFELAPENVAQAVKIASEYKNTPAMVALRKQQVEAYVKVGKLSKQEAEKKSSMQINRNANKYAKNMIWLKHIEAKKPQDVLEPK